MSDSVDDEFATLKPSLRRVIDTAFLKLSRRAHGTRTLQKKPRLEEPGSDEDGGFVKDNQDEQEVSEEEHASIPLSMVPTGLQMLDLPPDDEDVINVFRNAATGWESRPGASRRRGSESDNEVPLDKDAGLSVLREDWRAVCAVLLGQKQDDEEEDKEEERPKKRMKNSMRKPEQEQPERRMTRGQARAAVKHTGPTKKNIGTEDSDEGGGFLVEDEGGSVLGSDDEQGGFLPPSDQEMGDAQDGSDSDRYSDDDDASSVSEFGAPTEPKPTRSRTQKDELDADVDMNDDWENDIPRSLTVRQLKEAKLAFALFFPGVDANDPGLGTRRLGTKEVQQAAKALKENLSLNDIIEMLNMFSSAPDDLTMIALRHWLGKTGAPSCTYANKCCAAVRSDNAKLRELALDLEARLLTVLTASDTDASLQRALDENALQQMLIEQLQAQLVTRSNLVTAAAVAHPADYTALQERVSQLEAKLADSQDQLAKKVEELDRSKAHITALQQQREQLVLELEQVEDGFQAEVEKLHGDLQSWKIDLSLDSSENGTVRGAPVLCPLPPPKYTEPYVTRGTRAPSVTSTDSPAGALFEASLERTKAATRIWALEDEVERVRIERDSLRRRLGAGRASLIQLKRQASEVRMTGGKGPILVNVGRGLRSESQLTLGRKLGGRKGSNMQLNMLVRLPVHGEPLTPETSDDSASLDLKM
ncbi:putative filament domain protein [Rhizoctonia solani 123E]|uniref:Putative filament domain protein n=1 Tax=Rhizoctonia solani 123E TaxID=1423351 RepID=A0A074RP19_9AGAM|nr:putative filament domain protein [Rhizoctonia solani 123E]